MRKRFSERTVPLSQYGRIYSAAFDPTGNYVATCSADNVVRVWLLSSKRCVKVFQGHSGTVYCLAFSHDGKKLLSGGSDRTVRVWNLARETCERILSGHVDTIYSVAISPTGNYIASAGAEKTIRLWDLKETRSEKIIEGHTASIFSLMFSCDGKHILSGASDSYVRLWDVASGRCKGVVQTSARSVYSVDFSPDGRYILIGTEDSTVRLLNTETGRCERILEGHTASVYCVAFSPDGLTVLSGSADSTVRLWDVGSGRCEAIFEGHEDVVYSVSYNQEGKILSSCTAEGVVRLWKLKTTNEEVSKQPIQVSYKNSKVLLVGDSGVGKSGLSIVLNNQPFEATESTPGRRVWLFSSNVTSPTEDIVQARETLLWDLAGQPGYRIIHQLYLKEVAVALVVFDARSETDPLAGVRHWERALRLAQQRQGASGIPMRKFLVSARNDRGGVSIGEERLQGLLKEFKFDGYFKTSAKEGWAIEELRGAIEQSINWELLPEVSSSQLFADIKAYLLAVKESGQLLVPISQLYQDFSNQHAEIEAQIKNLKGQFETCVGRLENRDLIRHLTFGGYVLLQPELLDAYASAMVNIAKEEPDGLGSLAEESALGGKFFVPKEQKISDPKQEQLLLHATIEELVLHDLAIRESADDGRFLVFPSQFNRDYEDAPEPKGKAVAITFDGPVQSLYSTLVVRLGHSGLFKINRDSMWRNAAVFTAKATGKCGVIINEFSEGRGRLILFFDEWTSEETRFNFEEFVMSHAKRRALDDTVKIVRYFICHSCNEPVPDAYVNRLRSQGKVEFSCPCGAIISLAEPKERLQFASKVQSMDKTADLYRKFEGFMVSAQGELATKTFNDWAGGDQVTLAVVFTDVVGSTALGDEIKDYSMNELRKKHFATSRRYINTFNGREIKTIGDSFMVAFKCVNDALDYALSLWKDTGVSNVKIRAGIHIGPMHVEENDVFGSTINFAARVVGAIKGAEIWLSERAMDDIISLGAKHHKCLIWKEHKDIELKGFSVKFTLHSLESR